MEPKVEPTKPNTQLTSIPVIYKRGEYRDRLIIEMLMREGMTINSTKDKVRGKRIQEALAVFLIRTHAARSCTLGEFFEIYKDQCRYMTHKRFNEFPFQEGERNGDA